MYSANNIICLQGFVLVFMDVLLIVALVFCQTNAEYCVSRYYSEVVK
jgi:hypothetical protein